MQPLRKLRGDSVRSGVTTINKTKKVVAQSYLQSIIKAQIEPEGSHSMVAVVTV